MPTVLTSETIAVVPDPIVTDFWYEKAYADRLKQSALLFDSLMLPSLEATIRTASRHTSEEARSLAADLEWLADQHLVLPARNDHLAASAEDASVSLHSKRFDYIWKRGPQPHYDARMESDLYESWEEAAQEDMLLKNNYVARFIASKLHDERPNHSFPISTATMDVAPASKISKGDVVSLILHHFPIPEANTPWERILDFRLDSDSRMKLLRLRRWISDIAAKGKSLSEIHEEIEYLQMSYEAALKQHSIMFKTSTLECIVVTGAEFIENLLKLKLSSIAKLPFDLKRRQLQLLQAEASAEGRELAYLLKVDKAFGTS